MSQKTMRRANILSGAALSLLFSLIPRASAQGTNATCVAGFEWMSNSRGQSPCLMAAYLNGPCLTDPSSAYVFALPATYHYRPPIPATATPCQCSSVFYALLEGCAVCQGNPTTPWSTWETNCTTAVYQGVYPKPIPAGTSIPSWAYLDVVTPDNFNATAAQLVADSGAPESSAISPSSTSASSSATSVAPASSGGSKTNVGAIVGGVIAGIVGLAIIIGVAAFFVIRNRKKRRAPSAQYDASPFADKNGDPNVYNGQMGYVPPATGFTPPPQSYTPAPPTGRVYDPNDSTTYPLTGPDGSLSPTAYSSAPTMVNPTYTQPGQYRGAPEL